MKVTVSPGNALLFRVIRAVIVEVIVEFAATVDGLAESERIPVAIDTDTDLDVPCAVAVINAVPSVNPGLRTKVAIPAELVAVV